MSKLAAPSGASARRWPLAWRLAGLVLLGLMTVGVVVLELWPHPPGWLDGARVLVVDGLRWLRVHWLTSGALGVLVAVVVAALALGNADRRRDQAAQAVKVTQQAERAAAEQVV